MTRGTSARARQAGISVCRPWPRIRTALAAALLATGLPVVPPLARAQTAEPATSRDASSASDRNTALPGGGAVDLQRQVNELRSDLLDERERRIDSREGSGRLGTLAFGAALGLGILWANRVVKALAAAGFGSVDAPRGLLRHLGTARRPPGRALRQASFLVPPGPEAGHGAAADPDGQWPVPSQLSAGSDSGPDAGSPARLDPDSLQPLLAFAAAAGQQLREAAIADCAEAIRLDPCSPRPYLERGDVRAELGLFEEAIADYDRAIRLDPGNAVAYLRRCYAKAEAGRDDEAIEDMDRALRLDPDIVPEAGD